MTAVNDNKQDRLIEELAYKIKFGNLSGTQADIAMIRFSSELLKYKNLNRYLLQNLQTGDNLLVQTENKKEYDGEAFTRAFQSALAAYGKKDEATGELIPFLKLFNSHYKLKKQGIETAAFNEQRADNKIRKGRINDLLAKIAGKYGQDFERDSFNVLNSEKLQKKLEEWQVSKEKKEIVLYVLDNNWVGSDDIADTETGDDSGTYLSDAVAFKRKELSDNTTQLIADAFERGLANCKTTAARRWFKCIAAYRILNEFGDKIPFVLQKFADKNFAEYYIKLVSPDLREIDVLAAYMQVETETARKKVSNFVKFFMPQR